MKRRIILLFFLILAYPLYCQSGNSSDSLRQGALKVFFDCDFCDEDHIRREVSYVNYVRDRKEAEVHVLVTSERTGSGGRAYTFTFLGQNGYDNLNDTLVFHRMPDDTEEIERAGQINTLKMGLMRYVARTPIASRIDINYSGEHKEEIVEDKWRSWVFNTSLMADFEGEKSSREISLMGWLSANKITPEWKFDYDHYSRMSEDKYITEDEGTIYGSRISHASYVTLVKSINDHWSVGGNTSIATSRYSNFKLTWLFFPGIEYDLFPYYESTRRQLRFMYSAGYVFNNYNDTTIYNKTRESLLGHQFDIAYEVTQKWGSIETSLNWMNYFYDWSKNSLTMVNEISIRIAKGLELEIDFGIGLIHNQLNLPREGASTEDILLQVKELETSFDYEFDIGISYTFGAIYNNIVNPRFGGQQRDMYY
jgi:hypothetical protein